MASLRIDRFRRWSESGSHFLRPHQSIDPLSVTKTETEPTLDRERFVVDGRSEEESTRRSDGLGRVQLYNQERFVWDPFDDRWEFPETVKRN